MLTDGPMDGRTDGRTDGRMDDGQKVITIAHPEQSSGELKILCGYPLLSVAMRLILNDAL